MNIFFKKLTTIICVSSMFLFSSCGTVNDSEQSVANVKDTSISSIDVTQDSQEITVADTSLNDAILENSTDMVQSAIISNNDITSEDSIKSNIIPITDSNFDVSSDFLDTEIMNIINNMTEHEKICQLFIVTPEQLVNANGNFFNTVTEAGNTTKESLENYPVAGVIYFGQNVVSREQIITMNNNLQEFSKYGLFISVDEEGGEISRLAKNNIEGVTHLQDMSYYGALSNNVNEVAKVGSTLGLELKSLGFNVDFAPVADIEISSNHTMGERIFSDDPEIVGVLVSAEVTNMQNQGVCATLKHFPGLGATESDTHYGSVVLNRTIDQLRSAEFIPFKKGIDSGVEFVMVSHTVATGIGDNEPSDLSKKVVTDLLRNELGFNGVAITDAHTGMESITSQYTSAQATIEAIKAGIDIVLMPDDLNSSINAVKNAIQDGEISINRIDESLYRILSVKKEYETLKTN